MFDAEYDNVPWGRGARHQTSESLCPPRLKCRKHNGVRFVVGGEIATTVRQMRNPLLGLVVSTALLAMWGQAKASDVSCNKAKAAVAQMPEVDAIDQDDGHFAYRPGGSIDILCPTGGAVDLTIGADPLPGPEIWPFFGRLAQAVGVDPGQAIKAAQECRRTAEARLGNKTSGLFRGDPIDTEELHVDCRVSNHFLSLGVFRPG
jgi:hypothetical protein